METTREFTVAVFVVHADRVLLHYHRKLDMWLPPGGHIEPNELPDDAALREVAEETGVRARLIGERAIDVPSPPYPRQLARPAGIQLENIAADHQHIDLVYFAVPEPGGDALPPEDHCEPGTGWYALDELEALGANVEIRAWAARAVAAARARATP
jgi:ADP-ribose pyrophosphatase YjhB (NUDIX family)